MAIYSSFSKSEEKDYNFKPFISIIVPAYNEENVIKRRIENLIDLKYPKDKYEIIIVESRSEDETFKVAAALAKKYDNVKVLREEERKGKASAINFGRRYAKADIILVTDANDIFDKNVLKEIAPHFKNPKVGSVGGRFVLSNVENDLIRSSSFYWDLESLMRKGESNFDSACLFHGEINAWRKDIVKADENAVTEDLDMAINIRKKGFKNVYEPNAIVYECGPTSTGEQITQKKRTTIGTIQSFFTHKKYLWLPKDRYSGFIFPSHKTLQIFSPFLLITMLVSLSFLFALQKFNFLIIFIITAGIAFLISSILLNRKVSKIRVNNSVSHGNIIRKFFNFIYYIFLHEFIILLAWKDFLFGRYSVLWKKVESTRTLEKAG